MRKTKKELGKLTTAVKRHRHSWKYKWENAFRKCTACQKTQWWWACKLRYCAALPSAHLIAGHKISSAAAMRVSPSGDSVYPQLYEWNWSEVQTRMECRLKPRITEKQVREVMQRYREESVLVKSFNQGRS